MKQFCDRLRTFNKVHRLIGNVSCETLLLEATQAIKNTEGQLAQFTTMIDVGAGSGILGYAWLESQPDRRTVFVEPDRKALSFLHDAMAEETRAMVLANRIEDLQLERISDFAPDLSRVFLATRAFSSNAPLEVLYRQSGLALPLFSFEKHESKLYLVKKS